MNRTTNAELLKVAMNYLPLYDLSVKKMGEDYLSLRLPLAEIKAAKSHA